MGKSMWVWLLRLMGFFFRGNRVVVVDLVFWAKGEQVSSFGFYFAFKHFRINTTLIKPGKWIWYTLPYEIIQLGGFDGVRERACHSMLWSNVAGLREVKIWICFWQQQNIWKTFSFHCFFIFKIQRSLSLDIHNFYFAHHTVSATWLMTHLSQFAISQDFTHTSCILNIQLVFCV